MSSCAKGNHEDKKKILKKPKNLGRAQFDHISGH